MKENHFELLEQCSNSGRINIWNSVYHSVFHKIKADLRGADLRFAYLRDANLRGAKFRCADLRDAVFQNADLRDTDLRRANLEGADLTHADLRRANLQCANLRGANLQHANLRGADLRRADLQGAKIRFVDLRDADLRGADLEGATLKDASLRGADLRAVNLRDADLEGADLEGANLWYAILERADLRGANLENTKLPDYKVCPDEGDFEAYKAFAGGVVGKVLCSGKRTSNLISKIVRAERIKPIEFYNTDLSSVRNDGCGAAIPTVYKLNEWTVCSEFCDDIRVDCAPGIHVFMSSDEAKEWAL